MLKTPQRTGAGTLLEGLEELVATVPEHAQRFHELAAELRAELDKLKSRWSALVSGGTVDELARRLEGLRGVAGRIGELDRDARGLEDEVTALRQRAAELDELDVSRFVARLSTSWSDRLGAVVAAAEPGWDPGAAQDLLDDVEEEIRRGFQALYWLGQLEEALELFDTVPDDALRGRGRLRESLSELDEDWLLAARAQVERVKQQAEIEKKKPREIRTVAELLPSLHRWSTELGLMRDEVRRLDARHKKLVVEDWTGPLPRELLSEAQRLIQAMTHRGRELRDQDLADLRGRLAELYQICGEQPPLAEGLARLEQKEVVRPEGHRQWLGESARLRERVSAVASTHRAELERRLDVRLGELRDALAVLYADPLPDAVLERARRLEHEAEAIAEPARAEEALHALNRARQLLEETGELRHQALDEAEALRATLGALHHDNEALLAEAARAGLEVHDLAQRIDEIATADVSGHASGATGTGARSLELCKRAATALAGDLAALRDQFVERCRQRLEDDLTGVAELRRTLYQLDPETVVAEPPSIPAGTDPGAAARAVGAGQELARFLETRSRAVADELAQRLRRALEELRDLDLEAVDPGERDTADRLRAELEEAVSAAPSQESVSHEPEELRRLGLLAEKAELFRDRLEEEQRAVTERREALRRRLEAFLDDNLRELCPWLTDRATALIYGLPDPPPPTPDVRHQLEVSEDLVGKLERTARRLAAYRLETDVGQLREKSRAPKGGLATALLDELEQHGHATLPPAMLRLRTRRAAK